MEWNWGKLTDSDAWKQSLANLLRKGEDVGQYIAEAPGKAGQAIVEAGQRQGALMNKAFDPTGQTLIRDPQAANQAAMNLLEGPLGFAPVGMFIGPSAKGWSAENAFKAAQMEKAGKAPEEIWRVTGTARGLDGNWRQEIPDLQAKMISKPTKEYLASNPTMSQTLAHEPLYSSYEELATTKLKPEEGVSLGSFNPKTGEIGLKPLSVLGDWRSTAFKEPKVKTLLHESQHKIQEIEDWARGGGYNEFNQQADAELAKKVLMLRNEIERMPGSIPYEQKANQVKDMFEKLDQTPITKDVMDVVKDYSENPNSQLQKLVEIYGLDKKTSPYSPTQMYERLGGEAESRLTEARRKLTAEQRKQNFPFKKGENALDINPEEALIRTDSGIVTRKQLLEKLLNEQK